MLWQTLEGGSGELVFVRDFDAGEFVLPFYCEAAHLALEVRSDPPTRQENRLREPWQEEHRVDIMLVQPEHVIENVEDVVGAILEIAAKRKARYT